MRHTRLSIIVPVMLSLTACFGSGGPPTATPVPKTPVSGGSEGQLNPLPSTGGGSDVIVLPSPQLSVFLFGKPVVQDGSYGVGKLQAHAADSKKQPTVFHWMLTGPGIAAAATGDGADFSYDLPVVADQSAYELVVVGSLAGKAVQQKLNFFTLPAPTAAIVANVNQANGIAVQMADGGAVLNGKTITFTADAQFATQYQWHLVKNGVGSDLGSSKTITVAVKELGQSQVTLQTVGEGGTSPVVAFNFVVNDNAVPVVVESTVTKVAEGYSDTLKNQGKYPIGSTVTLDASKMGQGLSAMVCSVVNTNIVIPVVPTVQTATQSVFQFNTPGQYDANCTLSLNPGYESANKAELQIKVAFTVLPKIKAMMTVDGQNCDESTPALSFQVGATVKLSATNDVGNISAYLWKVTSGGLEDSTKIDAILHLGKAQAADSVVTLQTNGVGDSDEVACKIITKAKPIAAIAATSTVQSGRSYILKSFQQAHADLTVGDATAFVWKLLNVAGQDVVPSKIAQNFEFQLAESGSLSLQIQPQDNAIQGEVTAMPFYSKRGQVSLVAPVVLSGIQSVGMISATDAYFASPSAIYHKGGDGRVVQVADISQHPAFPDTLFVRNAGDAYLFAADGYWRYSYKGGWVFVPSAAGNSPTAIAGPSTGSQLFVAANGRLFSGDVDAGGWAKIGDGARYVTAMGAEAYAVATSGTPADPEVMSCSPTKCTSLQWKANSAANVTWKAIGASKSVVYLADANGTIYTIQNGLVAKIGTLPVGEYAMAFSRSTTTVFAISNHGGVYRLTPTGLTEYIPSAAVTITHATGQGSVFLEWDDVTKTMLQIQSGKSQALVTASSPGTYNVACAPQRMWMVGDVAYIGVCVVPLGKLALYSVWSAAYQGEIASNGTMSTVEPIVGITDDGAGGILVLRSGNGNNYIQQLAAGANQPAAFPFALPGGENFVGASGKFFITSQGIRFNDGLNYPLVPQIDAHYAAASGDVIYFSFMGDTRVGKYDANTQIFKTLGNVGPQETIVDVLVDTSQRVYALTAKSLYRYDGGALTKVYDAVAPLMNAMAGLNGHHILVSLQSKGMVLVDLDDNTKSIEVDTNGAGALSAEIWSVGYNGTEFLFYGRDMLSNALFLHEFGAPQ